MGKVYRLEGYPRSGRRSKTPPCFSRTDIDRLLSLYSRRVASGEWRDYAIDLEADMAVFSVYRHTHDRPLFSIVKRRAAGGKNPEYMVFSGQERIRRAASIAEALRVFERDRPHLVVTGPR